MDAVKLGWFSIKDSQDGPRMTYRRQKTRRHKKPVLVSVPIADDLRAMLDTCDRNAGTFLQTVHGKQRSPKTVTGDMRQ